METRPLFIDDFEPIEPCRLTYNVFTDFTTELADDFLNWIFEVEEYNDYLEMLGMELPAITINIMSNGGDLFALFAMIDGLKLLDNKIITRAFGIVASSAFFLFLHGDVRIAGQKVCFLYHKISMELPLTSLNSVHKQVSEMYHYQDKLDQFVVNQTNITQVQLDAYDKEDWLIYYDEAKELGIVTE